jgi:uncharacterized membrane protein YphA (DoxX/SURF4 family)
MPTTEALVHRPEATRSANDLPAPAALGGVTATIEIMGVVALLIPGFAGPGAMRLGMTTDFAFLNHLLILHSNPAQQPSTATQQVQSWFGRQASRRSGCAAVKSSL